MATLLSPRQFGEELDLPHQEVIRRIRRGDIEARKLGNWNWAIDSSQINVIKAAEWYQKRMARQAREEAAAG